MTNGSRVRSKSLFKYGRLSDQKRLVRSYHISKEVRRPVIGQELPVLSEPNDRHDKRVVAIYMDGVIGYLQSDPRSHLDLCVHMLFLWKILFN